MDLDLIKQILVVAIASSIVSTATIQKIKEILKNKTALYISAFLISIAIGICFALSFSDLSLTSAIWVGLITWVGADTIYKAFEDKIFTSFSDMNNKNEITIDRDDVV